MRTAFLIGVLLLSTSFHYQVKEIKNELTCVLTSNKKVYGTGETPKLKIAITNNTDKEIYLINSFNDYEPKYFPKCFIQITKPEKTLPSITLTCGSTSQIEIDDFKKILPGETFIKDKELSALDFGYPGNYKIRFHYNTSSANINDYKEKGKWNTGTDTLRLMEYFNQTPKVQINSNEISITIL